MRAKQLRKVVFFHLTHFNKVLFISIIRQSDVALKSDSYLLACYVRAFQNHYQKRVAAMFSCASPKSQILNHPRLLDLLHLRTIKQRIVLDRGSLLTLTRGPSVVVSNAMVSPPILNQKTSSFHQHIFNSKTNK